MFDIDLTMLFVVFGVGTLLSVLISCAIGMVWRPRGSGRAMAAPAQDVRHERVDERQPVS
jgi:hypothetical protein